MAIGSIDYKRLLFIWQLQAVAFLLVFDLQCKAEQECQDAQ